MGKYQGVIFDLDGTLLNTIYDLCNSVNEALEQQGYPVLDLKQCKQNVGHGFRNLIQKSLPEDHRSDKEIDETLALFIQAYAKGYMVDTVPYEGMTALIDKLHHEGIALAVNSNKRDDYTNNLVKKFFPDIPWVGVYGERKDIPRKPDPEGALEITKKMGLEPKDVLYIGDSETDMMTGENGCFDTVGVDWGFRGKEVLEKQGATYIALSPKDIEDVIFL